jgi:hypothetical protein
LMKRIAGGGNNSAEVTKPLRKGRPS